MERKEDYEISTLRTIAIMLVVLLHSNASKIQALIDGRSELDLSSSILIFISVITRIAVPLFIMISGRYVLNSVKNYSLKEFYQKRLLRLILPLIVAIIIYFPIYLFGVQGATVVDYLKDIATGFASNGLCIHLWYMYMLLGLYIVSPFLYRILIKFSDKKKIIFAIGLCILGMVAEIVKNISGIDIWLLWWVEFIGLFTLGYLLKDVKLKNKRWILFTIAVGIEVVSSIISVLLILKGSGVWQVFHMGVVPNAQITTVLIYLFANSFQGKENILSKVSKYSLGIYIYHQIVIVVLRMVLSTGIDILDVILGFIISFIIPLVIMKGLYKINMLRKFIS